jgi:hypothetical protein
LVFPAIGKIKDAPMNSNISTTSPAAAKSEVEPLSIGSIMERAKVAMERVGIDPSLLREHMLARLEKAADAYERAMIPADADFWHAESVRVSAALASLLAVSPHEPTPAENQATK